MATLGSGRRSYKRGRPRGQSIGSGDTERIKTSVRIPTPSSVTESEPSTCKLDYEVAHCFSLNGKPLFSKRGGAASVGFDDEEQRIIENSLFIHNHPSGKTFFLQDVRFIEATNPAECRIVIEARKFIIVRPGEVWGGLLASYERHFRTSYKRNLKDLQRGKINVGELDRRTYFDAMKCTARDLKFECREEAFNDGDSA